MAELVAGAAVGIALQSAWTALREVASSASRSTVFGFAKICSKLTDDLQLYDPYLKLIFDNIDPAAPCEWEKEALLLKQQIDECRELVEKYQPLRDFGGILKLGKRNHVGKKIAKLREMIKAFMQGTRLVITQIAQLEERWMSQLEEQLAKPEDEEDKAFREMVDEGMAEVKDGIQRIEHGVERNGAMVNALMRRLEVENGVWSVPPLPSHVVGLDEHVLQLRSMLLSGGEKNPKMVAIVGEQDGIGKSTLASALCNDQLVRDFFKQGIHFITVSKSRDLFILLSTIWTKVTGEELSSLPHFRNLDDVYAQLCHKLADHMQLSPSSKHLLVLDDINSKKILQKLTFNIPGLWTLVTTRRVDKLNEFNTHIYTLECLDLKNARRLFCYYKFGSEDIPSWANERLVQEAISKCKGHPLALKVMSGSVSNVGQHYGEKKTEEVESKEDDDEGAMGTFVVAKASSFQVDIEEQKNEEAETEEKNVGAKATSVAKESSFRVDIDSSINTGKDQDSSAHDVDSSRVGAFKDVGESPFDTNGEIYSKVKNNAYDGESATSVVKESSFVLGEEAPATEESTFDAETSRYRNVPKVQTRWFPRGILTKKSSVADERVEETLASPVDGEEEEASAPEESASEEEEEALATDESTFDAETSDNRNVRKVQCRWFPKWILTKKSSVADERVEETLTSPVDGEEVEASTTEESTSEEEEEAPGTEESTFDAETSDNRNVRKVQRRWFPKWIFTKKSSVADERIEETFTCPVDGVEDEASATEESASEEEDEAPATEESTFDAETSENRNVRKVQRTWFQKWILTKKSSVADERVEETLTSPVDGEEDEASATEESAFEEEEEAASEKSASEEDTEAFASEESASEVDTEGSASEESASDEEAEASASEESENLMWMKKLVLQKNQKM